VAGRDFTQASGVLTFPANPPSKTFNVPILNDTLLDGDRSVMLALANPTGGAGLGTVSSATQTIAGNEQAGQFKLDKSTYTVLESAGFVSITARNDEIAEEGESVALTLRVPVGAATLGRATTTLRILDAPTVE